MFQNIRGCSWFFVDTPSCVYVRSGGTVSSSTLIETDTFWTIVGDAFGHERRTSHIDVDGYCDNVISASKDNSLSGVLYFADLEL